MIKMKKIYVILYVLLLLPNVMAYDSSLQGYVVSSETLQGINQAQVQALFSPVFYRWEITQTYIRPIIKYNTIEKIQDEYIVTNQVFSSRISRDLWEECLTYADVNSCYTILVLGTETFEYENRTIEPLLYKWKEEYNEEVQAVLTLRDNEIYYQNNELEFETEFI